MFNNSELAHAVWRNPYPESRPASAGATVNNGMIHRRQGVIDRNILETTLSSITTATKPTAAPIEDLLRFSTPSSTCRYSAELIDAEASVKIAIANLQSVINESGAMVEWTPLPMVRIDGSSPLPIFQNLIGNAIRYRSAAVPRIRISAEQGGNFWRFSCQDIQTAAWPGLCGQRNWLALCKKIIQRYGGAIWVESKPGTGFTFGSLFQLHIADSS